MQLAPSTTRRLCRRFRDGQPPSAFVDTQPTQCSHAVSSRSVLMLQKPQRVLRVWEAHHETAGRDHGGRRTGSWLCTPPGWGNTIARCNGGWLTFFLGSLPMPPRATLPRREGLLSLMTSPDKPIHTHGRGHAPTSCCKYFGAACFAAGFSSKLRRAALEEISMGGSSGLVGARRRTTHHTPLAGDGSARGLRRPYRVDWCATTALLGCPSPYRYVPGRAIVLSCDGALLGRGKASRMPIVTALGARPGVNKPSAKNRGPSTRKRPSTAPAAAQLMSANQAGGGAQRQDSPSLLFRRDSGGR
jgi:hypothetical protein